MSFSLDQMASINNIWSNSSEIRIGHINVCSLNPTKSKFLEIHKLLFESKLDIIGISETWLSEYNSNEAVNLEGYTIVRCDRQNRRGGGVALYISNKFKFNIIMVESYFESLRCCYELLVVEIISLHTKLVGILYVPPSSDILTIERINRIFNEI